MAVPNSDDFDIKIVASTLREQDPNATLIGLIQRADGQGYIDYWDLNYSGSKNSLLNFRNFKAPNNDYPGDDEQPPDPDSGTFYRLENYSGDRDARYNYQRSDTGERVNGGFSLNNTHTFCAITGSVRADQGVEIIAERRC